MSAPQEGPYDWWILSQLGEHRRVVVRLWIPRRVMIVLGRFGDARYDLHLEALDPGVVIKQRLGGGGTVVLDPQVPVLEAGFWSKSRKPLQAYARWLGDPLCRTLRRLGVPVRLRQDWFDYVVGDRKVAGSTFYLARERVIYGVSLVYARTTVDRMERYLRLPRRQPAYRAGRRHRDFVQPLEAWGVAFEDLVQALEALVQRLQQEPPP